MTVELAPVRPPTNATEEKLLDAALTLFAQKGFESASVREIIEAAGVTRPVLYYYCSSKEDLFKRLVHWKHDQAYRDLGELMKSISGAEERLRTMLQGSFAFCVADPRVPKVMFQTAFGPPIPGITEFMDEIGKLRFSIVMQVMEEGTRHGELAERDAASLALMFCCLMDQHINSLIRLPNPQTLLTAELAASLVSAFLHGVGK